MISPKLYSRETSCCRWMFSAWSHSGLTVLPGVNLVSNIGFGEQATHALRHDASKANLGLEEMVFPLKHRPYVIRDAQDEGKENRGRRVRRLTGVKIKR